MSITVTPYIKAFNIAFPPSSELDIAGYKFHAVLAAEHPSGTFTPDDSNLIYQGSSSSYFHTVGTDGNYLVRVAAYDTFGTDGLNYSAPVTATALPGGLSTNSMLVYAYQRSASTLTSNPGEVTVTFGTGITTPATDSLGNGWKKTIPAGTDPLYVTIATAASMEATDTVAAGEWSAPVILASNGAVGNPGLNVATAILYQKTATNVAPAAVNATVTFTFADGSMTGQQAAWTKDITGSGAYLWVTRATASSTGATDNIAAGEWSAPALMAQDGAAGAPGYSIYTVTVYRQNNTPGVPSGGTYNFVTATLTPPDNWTVSQPASSTTPTYASTRTFVGLPTDTENATGSWSTPYIDALNGTNGDGGVSIAVVEMYKENGGTLPTGTTYTFSTGVVSGTLNGWSQTMPTVTTNPMYMTTCRFAATAPADTQTNSSWSTAVVVAKNGISALTGYLTNESHTVATASDGSGGNYSSPDPGGTFKVFLGTTDVTTSCTFAVVGTPVGITGYSIGAATGIYTLTGLSTDAGSMVLRATHTASGATLDKTYSISKSKSGADSTVPGPAGKVISLSASRQSFSFTDNDLDTVPIDVNKNITFEVTRQNTSENITWACTDETGAAITPLTSTSNTGATLTSANFGTTVKSITVKVTGATSGLSDTVTIVRLNKSTAAPNATNTTNTNQLTDGANLGGTATVTNGVLNGSGGVVVDNSLIKVGGRNILLNSGFEFAPFPTTGSSTSLAYPLGNNSPICVAITKTVNADSFLYIPLPDLAVGKYTMAMDVKAELSGKSLWSSTFIDGTNVPPSIFPISNPVPTVWTRYTIQFEITTASSSGRIILRSLNAVGDGVVYYDNLKLESGNIATDWTPAPEDVEAQFAAIASDSILSKGEKPYVITNYNITNNEYSEIIAKADALVVSRTRFSSSKVDLDAWATANPDYSNTALDSTLVGITFGLDSAGAKSGKDSLELAFRNYNVERQVLVNAMLDKASTMATWGASISGRPTTLSALDSSAGTKLGGIEPGATVGAIWGTTLTGIPTELIASSGLVLSGNNCTGGTGAWDKQCYSNSGFTYGAFCSFQPSSATEYCMAGLNTDTDRVSSASYLTLDFAWFLFENSSPRIYENGTEIGVFGTYVAGDTFSIVYYGNLVVYYHNGVAKRTIATATNQTFYFDSSFVSATLNNIKFGPVTSNDFSNISGTTRPENNATVGAPGTTPVGNSTADVVVSNAANGATAYTGTTDYRGTTAPSNSPAITSVTYATSADGNVTATINYTYTQGAITADSLLVYIKEGAVAISAADPAFTTNPVSGSITFNVKPSTAYQYNMQALKTVASGAAVTTLIPSDFTSTSSAGNYTGNISGTDAAAVLTSISDAAKTATTREGLYSAIGTASSYSGQFYRCTDVAGTTYAGHTYYSNGSTWKLLSGDVYAENIVGTTITGKTLTGGTVQTATTVGDGTANSRGIRSDITGLKAYPANSTTPSFYLDTDGFLTAGSFRTSTADAHVQMSSDPIVPFWISNDDGDISVQVCTKTSSSTPVMYVERSNLSSQPGSFSSYAYNGYAIYGLSSVLGSYAIKGESTNGYSGYFSGGLDHQGVKIVGKLEVTDTITNTGVAKAWVNFDGTTNVGGYCTIRASHNVSSITDNGVGKYIINFTTAFADANYCFSGSVLRTGTDSTNTVIGEGTPTTSAFSIHTLDVNAGAVGLADQTHICVTFFN